MERKDGNRAPELPILLHGPGRDLPVRTILGGSESCLLHGVRGCTSLETQTPFYGFRTVSILFCSNLTSLPTRKTRVMGFTAWYFAIDEMNEAHPLTQRSAGAVFTEDYSIPPEVPRRDAHGALIAEVIVNLEKALPVEIHRINLTAVPQDEGSLGKPVSIARGVAAGIQMALRRKLGRRAGVPPRIEEQACARLAGQIDAGEYTGIVYRTNFDRLQRAVGYLGGERSTYH
jgi:hypothetical protein